MFRESSIYFFLRISEYKTLMKKRREEMRQLWCKDAAAAQAAGGSPFPGPGFFGGRTPFDDDLDDDLDEDLDDMDDGLLQRGSGSPSEGYDDDDDLKNGESFESGHSQDENLSPELNEIVT